MVTIRTIKQQMYAKQRQAALPVPAAEETPPPAFVRPLLPSADRQVSASILPINPRSEGVIDEHS